MLMMDGQEMIARHIRHYSPKVVGGSYNRRTKKPGDPSLSSTGSSNHSFRSASFRTRSSSPSTLEKKLVTITKDETKGLGITLRGGIEHGLGHFISAVEKLRSPDFYFPCVCHSLYAYDLCKTFE